MSAPQFLPAAEVAERYLGVRAAIADACRRAGRDPQEVRLLPVSKTVPVPALVESWPSLYAAGCRSLAENRVQEAAAKAEAFAQAFGPVATGVAPGETAAPRVAVIGALQTNKAGQLVAAAQEFQALDRPKVAAALQRRLAERGAGMLDVLLQVNMSREPQKSGVAPEQAEEFVAQFGAEGPYPLLRLRGLMTIAAQGDPQVRETFAELRQLRDALAINAPEGVSLTELSMGMSGDYLEAIAEGATTVRVGRAIFGQRPAG